MKVEAVKSSFKPVTITLESQDELDLLYMATSRIGGRAYRDVFGGTGTLCRALEDAGATEDNRFRHTGGLGGINLEFKEDY
tara:strand:+ start:117 stop:359 length:243 start_codon:yes stop_codon:yes gene_type:complete